MLSSLRGLVAFALIVIPAWSQAVAEPGTTIRIGAPDQSVGSTPSGGIGLTTLLSGRKRFEDEFTKDGIKVEWTFFKGAGPAINEALANKQLDFVYLGDLASIIGRSSGLATRLLVPVRGNNAFLAVAPGSDIKRVEDLKGRRVTVFKGTAYQLVFDRVLAKGGLTERDLQVVNLDWNAALAALASKQLDANWAGLQAVTLEEKGLAHIAFSTRDLGREFSFQSGFLAREDFIAEHPDITQRFVDVVVREAKWSSQPENLAEFIAYSAERSGIPQSLGRAEFAGEDLKFRFSPLHDAFAIESYRTAVEQAKDAGLIRKTFDVQTWFEPKFVEKAVAGQKLEGFWPQYDKQGQPLEK